MRAIVVALGVVLLIPTVGSVTRLGIRNNGAPSQAGLGELTAARVEELRSLDGQAKQLASSGRYLQAATLFERGYHDSQNVQNTRFAIRFLINLANCRLKLYQFRPAMEAYLGARKLAAASGDHQIAAVLSTNISSLYITQGAFDEADEAIQEALESIKANPDAKNLARTLLLRAYLLVRKKDTERALPLIYEAIDQADKEADDAIFGLALETLAEALLSQGQYQAMEDVLGALLRRGWVGKDETPDLFYLDLSMLRLAQGNLTAASQFADEAFASARRKNSLVPAWLLYYSRAKVYLAQGELESAYRDLHQAFRFSGDLRLALLPADSVRTGASVDLQEVCDLYIEAASRLFLKTSREELARGAFEAAEQNRALGLRESLRDSESIRSRLSPEYWETLRNLTEAENQLFLDDDPQLRRLTVRLRHDLTELEIDAGLKAPGASGGAYPAAAVTVDSIERALGPTETLFSFWLGKTNSYVWAVTRNSFAMYPLGTRDEFQQAVKQNREAIQAGDPMRIAASGKQIYQMMFGGVSPRFLQNADWLLLLDGPLFEVPLGGLVLRTGEAHPEYLVERHSLRVLPGSAMLLAPKQTQWSGPLLAVSDPVYNTADPRWVAPPLSWSPASMFGRWKGESLDGPQFARLPGSAQETRACAKAYQAPHEPAILLSGGQATLRDFKISFARTPAVVHLATHVVPSPGNPNVGNVAFSLRPEGGPELLGMDTISSLQLRTGLVVMSGCRSGAGDLLPAEGLWGLTRAWLRAGAHNVAATLWPTLDYSGDLLQSFYRHLGTASAEGFSVSPAKALQLAQIEMLQSGTWRAEPRHWANYVIFSKR